MNLLWINSIYTKMNSIYSDRPWSLTTECNNKAEHFTNIVLDFDAK